MSFTGCLDTDIYILNLFHDYELMPLLLVSKYMAGIVKMRKFWAYRIAQRLGSTLEERNNSFEKAYQLRKMSCAIKNGYAQSRSRFVGLKYAVAVDLRLTESNVRDMLLSSGSERELLYKTLPDVWYGQMKCKVIRDKVKDDGKLPGKIELVEYIRLSKDDTLQTFFDNLLFGLVSFEVQKSPKLIHIRKRFTDIYKLLEMLLKNGITPSGWRIVSIYQCKGYLNTQERDILNKLFMEHLDKFSDKNLLLMSKVFAK